VSGGEEHVLEFRGVGKGICDMCGREGVCAYIEYNDGEFYPILCICLKCMNVMVYEAYRLEEVLEKWGDS